MMKINVVHDQDNQVFYADIQGERAELTYKTPEDNLIDFKRTYVPENLRGNDIGKQIVAAGLDYAKQNNYRIITTCGFVKHYLHRGSLSG